MSDEAEEVWTAYITGGVILRQYDDGDIVIHDWHGQYDWDSVLLELEHTRKFLDLATAEVLELPGEVPLGEGWLGTIYFEVVDDGVEISTGSTTVTLTNEQVDDFIETVPELSPWHVLP